MQAYADDVKLYGIFSLEERESVRAAIRISLTRMSNWTESWEIPLNLSKCRVLQVGDSGSADYEIRDTTLTRCYTHKDLGVLIDSSLSFREHIKDVVKRACAVVFMLFRNIKCSDVKLLLRLYKSYVVPILEYCSPIWSPGLKKDITALEKVQHLFTRLLWIRMMPPGKHEVPMPMPSYCERLKLFSLNTLENRRILADLRFGYKVLKKELRLTASRYWIIRPSSPRIGRYRLQPLSCSSARRRALNTVFSRFARWLQLLPADIVHAENSKIFRQKILNLNFLNTLRNSRSF